MQNNLPNVLSLTAAGMGSTTFAISKWGVGDYTSLFGAFCTFCVTVVAIWYQYQQHKLNKERLALEKKRHE
jgi:hypothetical protein